MSHNPAQSQQIRKRAIIVWAAAVAIYIVAVTGRTSFGVAGVEALDRFSINAAQLAVFTAVQVGVYAASQIPVGLLIDKFGARRLLIVGALIMAAGQISLGMTSSYYVAIVARVLIGAGDATAFLSVLRLIPTWFPIKKAPLFAQITGGVGQSGQFLSAVPFLNLLHAAGWQVAFISLGAVGLLVALLASVVLSDTPTQPRIHRPHVNVRRRRRHKGPQPAAADTVGGGVTEAAVAPVTPGAINHSMPMTQILRTITRDPIVWQAVFIHWTNMLPLGLFQLLWGVPLMTLGIGLSAGDVGVVLTIVTITTVAFGPIHGVLSSRLGRRRDTVSLVLAVVQITVVAVFFLQPDPPSMAWLIVLLVFQTMVIPAANYGFDTVREVVDIKVLASATGLANMGGFVSTMIAAQFLGILLDQIAPVGDYTWSDFRVAWVAVFITWAVGYGLFVGFYLRIRKQNSKNGSSHITHSITGKLPS